MAPVNVPPMAEAMASSVLSRGGGLEGGDGFFFSSRPKNGRESLGRLGKLGKSMMDWETSSDRSLAEERGGDGDDFLGGGMSTVGDLEANGLEMVMVGVRLGAAGSAASFLATTTGGVVGFSGSGGGANLSLNPGMKRPVVVASVSNSGSSSLSPSSPVAAADSVRHFPLRHPSPD